MSEDIDEPVQVEFTGIQMPPKEIGYFQIGMTRLYQTVKPYFIHRYFMKKLLGFTWHDIN